LRDKHGKIGQLLINHASVLIHVAGGRYEAVGPEASLRRRYVFVDIQDIPVIGQDCDDQEGSAQKYEHQANEVKGK